jgi:hypothetical protein
MSRIGDVARGCREPIGKLLAGPEDAPLPIRWACVGAVWLGLTGGALGLAVGLRHPPTAWFAVLEAGIPATIVGAVAGLFVGLVAAAGRRLMR